MADPGLDLGAYLSQLENERRSLDIIIADVRKRLGLSPSDDGDTAPGLSGAASSQSSTRAGTGKVRSDEFFRMSIPEAVRRYMEIMKAPQTPTAIVGALKAGGVLSESKNFYTTVWTALKRLKKSGDIVNTRTGWGLSDWYPNKPKGGIEERRPKKKARKPKKAAQASQTPTAKAPPPAKKAKVEAGSYREFLTEQRKAGKTLEEIGAAWRAKKASAA